VDWKGKCGFGNYGLLRLLFGGLGLVVQQVGLFLGGLGLAVKQIWWACYFFIRFYNFLFYFRFIMSSNKSFGVHFIGKNYSTWEFQFQLFVTGKEL
jgi:hypothetical protein